MKEPLEEIADKIKKDPVKSEQFLNLFAGDKLGYLEKNHKNLNTIDFERLLNICFYNMFSVPKDLE